VPGLGASFGRGAATNYQQDLANSDCILIMGSNMAEAHPVGFRWPMKARERGARLIHVDPRYSRTSASCDQHVGIRAGTDIAFLGGIIHYILANDRWFRDYVVPYTNASTIIEEGFEDTEDLGGIFSGYDLEKGQYSASLGNWGYEGSHSAQQMRSPPSGGGHPHARDVTIDTLRHASNQLGDRAVHGTGLMGGSSTNEIPRHHPVTAAEDEIARDPTLQHPRCVMQILRRHYARYTPDMVATICGCRPEDVVSVAEALCENSGRERTSAIVYAVGWTQHTTGVQMIRAATIIQLLLGNIGRPGGGIMAMRGHATIQGSTDVSTLYDMLPGYLPQPVVGESEKSLDKYVEFEGLPTGLWANTRHYIVSLLKAWYGEAATADNDFRFGWLPRLDGDYSQLPIFDLMAQGKVDGYFLFGQNPAAGGPNARLHRQGLRSLKWLVVIDWFEIDSAVYWKSDPTGPPPEEVGTEVFFIPAGVIPEKEGSFTNTQRLLQWHDKAVNSPGDCHSDAWFVYNLGKRLKTLYAGSTDAKDQPLLNLTWDYDFDEPQYLPDGHRSENEGDPDLRKVLQEINGYRIGDIDPATGRPTLVADFDDLADDGSTACGCWIYSGVYPAPDRNRARDRERAHDGIDAGWGFAWPKNCRILYNRASADPQGRPWSERKRLIHWDEEQGKWVGADQPDITPDKRPDYRPPHDARGLDALAGTNPFVAKPDGVAWLFSPGKTQDGPLPTHYEPVESPIPNLLYPDQDIDPTTRLFESERNPLAFTPTRDYPVVACTFRLTEHYLSGPMSRFNSWLNELQPAMFAEISPELARLHGIEHAGWMTIESPRGRIEALAMVTRRIRPLWIAGRMVHQIGLPFHWGFAGETVGAIANDLTSLVADPNVSMHEGKVFACRVRAGRTEGQPRTPTKKIARWANREPVPDTPAAAQPEGHFK
jgi:formate dehydrogenase major subunit